MRDLILLRETIKELQTYVFNSSSNLQTSTLSTVFEPFPESTVFEDNESCLRLAGLG